MIPSALPALILALAALRCWRLLAADTLPPLVELRSWLAGAWESETVMGFDRPLVKEWIECPFCSGLWWSAAWYAAWLEQPRWALYAAAPLAISAAVGIGASVLP